MRVDIDYRLFHQRQERRSHVNFSLSNLPLEQTQVGGFEDSMKFTTTDYQQFTEKKAPRNPVAHPERLQVIELPLPFPQKGIIYRDNATLAAD